MVGRESLAGRCGSPVVGCGYELFDGSSVGVRRVMGGDGRNGLLVDVGWAVEVDEERNDPSEYSLPLQLHP